MLLYCKTFNRSKPHKEDKVAPPPPLALVYMDMITLRVDIIYLYC